MTVRRRPENTCEVGALNGEGSVVADVGAGSGFGTVRLAAAVGARRVDAVDIVPDVLQRFRDRVSKARHAITQGLTVAGSKSRVARTGGAV